MCNIVYVVIKFVSLSQQQALTVPQSTVGPFPQQNRNCSSSDWHPGNLYLLHHYFPVVLDVL